ncbi:hypothetical protein [Hyphomicrobium sulfonivorans]|uniref:hypothetical protein n=1 Tax=Hyphomicrobium sulfonivorans TaxID=121290 RepID=UPI00156F80A7|nr:hypothetical protein [Hyphomicrobium sulfonivorans]MBI1650651.1 hypothetical protein [Hyphomicrobium sulfonivorans]NSL71991.1 hypothetical protein [Hyphomicrobium sulfonivorans]
MPLDQALLRRALVTLAALAAYRLAAHLPLSGVDVALLARMSGTAASIDAASFVAIGIMPLVSALVLIETAKLAFPSLMRWQHATPENGATLARMGIILALALALAQAVGLTLALEDISGLVLEPGAGFRFTAIATLVSGTVLAIALASIIDRAGLGFGVWFLFLLPTLLELPKAYATQINLVLLGHYPTLAFLIGVAFVVLVAAGFVAIMLAGRTATPPPAAARATIETCIWTPLLASIWLPYGLVALGWILSGGRADATSFAAPPVLQIVFMMVLMLGLIAAGYTRSFARADIATPVPPVVVALAVFAVFGGGMLLQRFAVAVPFDRSPLVIAVAIAAAIAITAGLVDRARKAADA